MRLLPEETRFAEYFLEVGNGELNDYEDNIILPSYCVVKFDEVVETAYGSLIRNKKFDEIILKFNEFPI